MTIRGGSPPHPHDKSAANRTLPSDKTPTNTNELTQPPLSVQIYLLLHATSLSKSSCISERSLNVTFPKPLLMPWSSEVWRSTRLIAHWNSMSKRTPVGAQSCSGILESACYKTSSDCSLSGNPDVLFPSQHSCHFHQLASC